MATPPEAFAHALDKAADILKEECMAQLTRLGEECVTRIRQTHPGDWTDQTGNLRSSIGYAVFDYGRKVIVSAFDTVENGNEGSDKGRQYIDSLAREYSRTYALAVVAGMEYADYVETRRDVLEGAKLRAQQEVNQRLQDAMAIAGKRISKLFKRL